MADPVKSLVVKAGTTQQIPAADTLIVGAGIDASSAGALQIGASTATSIELKQDVSAAGDLAVAGAFDATGAASLASTLDVTGVATFAASIDVVGNAAVGGNLTVEGDLQVEGATTLVGTTQFQTDAEFKGNTTFGDDLAPDSVTFSTNTTVSLGNNKIGDLGAPIFDADAATKKYADDGLALKVAKAGDEMSGNLAMGGNKVTGLAAPSVDGDAANKQYVNEQDALKVSKSGDSMTGNLTMGGFTVTGLAAPAADSDAATKKFVDDADLLKLSRDGSLPMTGALNLDSHLISNVTDPVSAQDAATKKYTDDGLALKVAKAGDSMSGDLAMGNNIVSGLKAPSDANDAARKVYVDDADALKVAKAGDTMSGDLAMGGNIVSGLKAPSADGDAANKKFVVDEDAKKLSLDGSLAMLANLDMGTHKIVNVVDPTSAQDAVTKKYADDTFVDVSGDTMSGNLAMGGNIVSGLKAPVDANDAARKLYVDDQDALKVSKAGDSMTGALAMGANKITGLADPTAAQDAVTKKYADDTFVDVAGDTMTGILSMGSNKITDLAPGSDPADAVNFEQLQNAIANIDPAGSDGDIQFNADDVELGADEKLHWVRASSRLGLGFAAAEYASIAKQLDVKGDARVTGAFSVVGSASVSVDASIAGNLSVTGTASVTSDASVGGTFSATGNASFAANASIAANLKADGEFWIDAEAALPAGEAGYGKLAVKSSGDGVLYFIDGAGQAHYAMADGLDSSLSGPAPVLDLDPALPAYRSIAISGNTAFTTDHRAAGRGLSLKLDNSAGASSRTLSFPSGPTGWKWLGGSAPALLEAGKIGIVSIVCYGSDDSDIVAAWSYSDSVQITGAGTPGQVAFFDVTTRTITSEAALAWDKDNDLLTVGGDLSVGGDFDVAGAAAFAAAVEFAGAVSLTAAGSIDATLGMVDLPAEFKIDGSAVSADVSAENLNILTAGPASDASALHSHPSVGIPVTAAGLASGDVVRITGASTVGKADADAIATARVAGIVGEANQLIVAGAALAKFKAGLTLAAGEPVYLSEVDAGELTNVAPTSGVVAEVGLVLNPAQTSSKALILVQVKAPIMLVA